MTNQEIKNPVQQSSQPPISPQRIIIIRLVNDLIITLASVYFLLPILSDFAGRMVLLGVVAMLICSGIGYFLASRGQVTLGIGFTIYGLIANLALISVFVDRLGPFALVTMVLITTLSVSHGFPIRRVVEAISVSIVVGLAALVFDLNMRGADFRLPMPVALSTILWFMTLGLALVILFLLARQFPYFSLRGKMIAAFTLATVAALTVAGYLHSRDIQKVLTEEANQSLFDAASFTESSLRQFIDFNLAAIRTEANLPVFVDYLSAPASERADLTSNALKTLWSLSERNPEFLASYALLDLQGNVLIDTVSEHTGASEADLPAFSEPISRGAAVMSPVMVDPFAGEPSLYFSSPVVENGSTILGVLRIRFRADVLQQLIAANNDRGGQGSYAVLFDQSFGLLAHGRDPENIFQTQAQPMIEQNLIAARDSSAGVVFFETTDMEIGNPENRAVVLDLGEPDWLLAYFQPAEVFMAPIEQMANNTILLSFVSAFGSIAFAILLTQILTAPILRLTEKANQLAKGDFSTRVEITTRDEIGELGRSFNSMTYQLQNLVGSLESQVTSRTKELQNRAAQLQASAEVARDASSEQSLQQMLDRAATLIHDRFGYYHVGMYLTDAAGENAILAATTDGPGIKLLELEHQYSIGPESNVGYACLLGEAIVATSDDSTPALNFHPILAGSQAQLVLPLKPGKETIGVIDIHSTNPIAFSNEEDKIFQTLADQLAIAVEKLKVQEEIQKALSELETAYGAFTRTAWQRFIQTRQNISGYRFSPSKKVETVSYPPEDVLEAWEKGERINQQRPALGSGQPSTSLAIPIKVRGSVIGVLDVEFETSKVPTDTTNLINEISERLSLILENARLIETAQRQVQRERLTSEITNTIRQSLDLDVVLRTAVQEIGEKLGLTEVELRIGDQEQGLLEGIRPDSSRKSNGSQSKTSEEAA